MTKEPLNKLVSICLDLRNNLTIDERRTLQWAADEIERLQRREQAARAILEPLSDCDPAIREWLKESSVEPTPEYRKWPGEPPHCMSCDCGMTEEQKAEAAKTVPFGDYKDTRDALMEIAALKVSGPSPLGALHGAGIAKGFEIAANIAHRGLNHERPRESRGEKHD